MFATGAHIMKSPTIRKVSTLSVCVLALLIGACSSSTTTSGDDYADGAPELSAVQMSITGDTSAEGLATADDAVDPTELASAELSAVTGDAGAAGTPDLSGARQAVHDLNEALRDSLQSVAALVRNVKPTVELGDLRLWGPVTRGLTEYRFFMRHPGPHVFGWRLDARVANSGTAWVRIAAGRITVGIAPRRGAGIAGFDLSALGDVDPTVVPRGQILAGFAHGKLGTTLAFAVKGFSRDPAVQTGVDALLQEVHLDTGINRVRLAYRGNVQGTATAADELVFARVRHIVGTGGRSDMLVTSGDVPAGTAWVISQCWDAGLGQVFRIVRTCPLDGIGGASCSVMSTTGNDLACAVDLRLPELPPGDPNQSMTDTADPNGGVTPPTSIPDVQGDTADAG
jgi:hypothetical protein